MGKNQAKVIFELMEDETLNEVQNLLSNTLKIDIQMSMNDGLGDCNDD